MNTNNDITGDRITNALKGDKDKYREGWEAIFGKKKPTLEDKQKHFEKTKMENFKHSSRLEGVSYDKD